MNTRLLRDAGRCALGTLVLSGAAALCLGSLYLLGWIVASSVGWEGVAGMYFLVGVMTALMLCAACLLGGIVAPTLLSTGDATLAALIRLKTRLRTHLRRHP